MHDNKIFYIYNKLKKNLRLNGKRNWFWTKYEWWLYGKG